MTRMMIQRFSAPDETRPFVDKGRLELLHVGDSVVGRGIFEPGWRWSKHVKPIAQTPSCQAAHSGYVLSGRMRIVMDDGQQAEIAPGDFVTIPPGHDAWTALRPPRRRRLRRLREAVARGGRSAGARRAHALTVIHAPPRARVKEA
jgi:quercetin dioxygenase-like cupin family protein